MGTPRHQIEHKRSGQVGAMCIFFATCHTNFARQNSRYLYGLLERWRGSTGICDRAAHATRSQRAAHLGTWQQWLFWQDTWCFIKCFMHSQVSPCTGQLLTPHSPPALGGLCEVPCLRPGSKARGRGKASITCLCSRIQAALPVT